MAGAELEVYETKELLRDLTDAEKDAGMSKELKKNDKLRWTWRLKQGGKVVHQSTVRCPTEHAARRNAMRQLKKVEG